MSKKDTLYRCHHCGKVEKSMDEIGCAKCDKEVAFQSSLPYGGLLVGAEVISPSNEKYSDALGKFNETHPADSAPVVGDITMSPVMGADAPGT